MATKNKATIFLLGLDGSRAAVEADLSKVGAVAIHKVDRGYALTDVGTGRVIGLTRLKREALEARRALETIDPGTGRPRAWEPQWVEAVFSGLTAAGG